MKNVMIVLEYDGTFFLGYQKQKELRTVQKELEDTLKSIFSKEVKTFASGRTDRGVHARYQCVNFYIPKDYNISLLRYKLNKMLSSDMHVSKIREVSKNFHARYSVKRKKYSYYINTSENSPFNNKYVYNLFKKLDIKKLKEASDMFKGTNSFKNFCAKEEDDKGFIRTIYSIKISENKGILKITLVGDGFLKYSIRMIVGNLVAFALDKITLEEIKDLINLNSNKRTSFCLPSQGLFLERVYYR